MKKKIYPVVITTLILTLINTGALAFITGDKVAESFKNRPVVISKSYDKGQSIELALETKKPMVVWFYTDWCRYCQKFAPTFKKITKDKDIKNLYAVAYVNAEKQENKEYTKEYKIEGYPTVYLVDGDNKVMIEPALLFAPNAKELLKDKMLDFLK